MNSKIESRSETGTTVVFIIIFAFLGVHHHFGNAFAFLVSSIHNSITVHDWDNTFHARIGC